MSERRELAWQTFLFASIVAYFVSLFLNWWGVTFRGDSSSSRQVFHVNALGNIYGSGLRLSELCVVIAVALLVVTFGAWGSDSERLVLARRQLAFALVIFNALAVLEVWRLIDDTFSASPFFGDSYIAYGAYVAIAASLLVLFSVLVLDAGGVRRLFTRDRTRDARVATASEADR